MVTIDKRLASEILEMAGVYETEGFYPDKELLELIFLSFLELKKDWDGC